MQRLNSFTGALAQACSRTCSAATPGFLAPGSCALLANIRNSNTAHTPSTIPRSSQLQPHAYSLSDTSPLWSEHIQALAQCSHANRSNAATVQPGHHQTFAQRGFATRATQDTAGPAAGMLSAVPFTISRQEADAAFEAYHSTGSNILLARPAAGLQKVKELYLPLWVCRAQVESVLRGAEIGFMNLVMRTNPATRQKVPSFEVRWRYVRPNAVINQYFSPEMLEMQIVASYHYPAADIRQVRPGPLVLAATLFERHMMTSPADGTTRRMLAFDMKAQTGQMKAVDAMQLHQQKAAHHLLRKMYRCHLIRGLELDVQWQNFTAAPVYMPVYLYSSRHVANTKIRTFVSGITASKVSGVRVFDEGKVGLAAAAVAAAAVSYAGAWNMYPAFSLIGFAIAAPALLVGFGCKYWPYIYNQFQQARRDAEQYMNRITDETGSFSTTWTHDYSQFEQFRRSHEQRASSSNYDRAGQSSADPKGYYKLLEVEPTASKADIQAAFRGLAMKEHPDRFEDPKQKQKATVRFRHILEAYSVLRDERKRQQYDAGQL